MKRRVLAFLLMMTMAVCFWPVSNDYAYAAAITSDGGNVSTNDTAQIKSAFGGRSAVTVTGSGDTVTVTLNSDIKLTAPIEFEEGAAGDKVVIDLNGHTITGADGIENDGKASATGKDAFRLAFKDFDITVQGPGIIRGGTGAIYDNGLKRFGAAGGAAIMLTGTGSYAPSTLQHGLTVTGGAQIIGGNGADGTFDDWQFAMLQYDGSSYLDEFDRVNMSTFMCGDGGSGIDQVHTYQSSGAYHNYMAMLERSFAKINIENGTVSGGRGGDMDFGNNPLDALTIEASEAMQNLSGGKMYGNIYPGSGGTGITFYSGRKYIGVGAQGTVRGGDGGSYEFAGNNKLSNWIQTTYSSYGVRGVGGSGIYCYGDSGNTNAEASLTTSNWSSKTANSNDVGIYIKGKVIGGNSQGTDARNAQSYRGGHGIEIDSWYNDTGGDGSYSFEEDNDQWGIILVDTGGEVNGGNAGDAVCESAGEGGSGICVDTYHAGYCEGVVVKGNVSGGNGGSTKGDATWKICPGYGGTGVGGIDEIYGTGTIKAGDGGSALVLDTSWYGSDDKEPADPVAEEYRDKFTRSGGTLRNGAARTYTKKSSSGLSAAIAVSEYTNYPNKDTVLTCNATLPAGYLGNVYYEWRMEEYYKDPVYGSLDYATFDGDTEIKIKSNSPSFKMYDELVKEIVSTQHANDYTDIFCYVMLEDGRCIKSDKVTIDPCRIGYTLPQPVINGSVKELAWNHVVITWDAPEDEDSIDGYTISRGTTEYSTYSDWTLATVMKGEKLEYTDTFVTNKEGQTYYYKIRTFDSDRSSTETYVIKAKVPYRPMPPINDLSVSQSGGNVTLNWSEPDSEEYTSHDGYRIYRDDVLVDEVDNRRTTSWIDPNAKAGKTYTYYVTSFWPEFDESAVGNKVTITVTTAAQQACSHASTTETVTSASTEADGSKKVVCDECGLELSNVIIRKIAKITINDQGYTGNPVTPDVTVTDDSGKVISSENYTVTFENNTEIGIAKATITFKGNYTGTVTKEFKIVCAHSSTREVSAKAADCTNGGNSRYWICEECDEYFSSADCTESSRIKDKSSVIISALGHSPQTVKGVGATCLEDGVEDTIVCKRCGETLSGGDVIKAKGHSWSKWLAIEAGEDTGMVEQRECSVCHITETRGYDLDSHEFEETFTVDQKAAPGVDGSMSRHCVDADCGVTIDCQVIPAIEDYVYLPVFEMDYTGEALEPEVTIMDMEEQVIDSINYSVEYTDNIEPGTATVTVTFNEDSEFYTGTMIGTFSIIKEVQNLDVPESMQVIAKKTQQIEVPDDLYGEVDFTVANKKIATVSATGLVKGIKAGVTTVTVIAAGDELHDPVSADITIYVPTKITKGALTKTSYTYNGEEQMPVIKTVNGKKTLLEGTDYVVEWPEGSVDAGKYTVTITGINKFYGSKNLTYTINKANQTIDVDIPYMTVNDTAQLEPEAIGTGEYTYKSGSTKIATVYADGMIAAKKAGTAKITITKATDTNYKKATKTIKVKIVQKDNSITVDDLPETLTVGDTFDLNTVANGKITYTTSSKTIATVTEGVITANKAGKATITIKAGDTEYKSVSKKIIVVVTN